MLTCDFSGKVALVTGGASGIGAACVQQFAANGAAVLIADQNEELGRELAAAIDAGGGRALFHRTDVSHPDSADSAVRRAVQHLGRLDYAVNSAGITGKTAKLLDYSIDDWQQVMNVNLHSVFYGMRSQIKAMLARID